MDPLNFDPMDRERFRNPPAPLGYQQNGNPDIVRRVDEDEINIDFEYWDHLGMFKIEDITIYDKFVINSDSEDENEIIEVPVEPVVKNIESICLSDDDEDEFIPVENIKKEKEDKTEKKPQDVINTAKIDSSKEKETKISGQKTLKKTSAKDDEIKRVKSTDQRTTIKILNKAAEAITEKKTHEHKEKTKVKSEKHRDKKPKRDEQEPRHKKIKQSKTESDSSRRKSRLSGKEDSDSEIQEERPRRKEKRYHSSEDEDYKEDYSYFKREYYDTDYSYDYPSSGIKQEYPSVSGVYYCDICNLNLNSEVTYQSHMTGKRHKKNMDARNVAQAVAKSYVPTKPISKCPNPPAGFKRVEISPPATIQDVLDEKLKVPSPGLHMVTEIHSLHETSYYCTLCDAPCSANSILAHLNGFKHQLNCLKHYDRRLFDEISYKSKYQIGDLVSERLKEIEKKYERGQLKVEKDVPDNGTSELASIPSTSSMPDSSFKMPSRDKPSSSKGSKGAGFLELYEVYSQPDPNKAGFYCRLCLSHSNSQAMWEAHIRGKRHLANLKKTPGTAPSKSRNVPAPPGTVPRLYAQLEGVEEPIVGLDQIREILRLDIDSVSYTCFLCGGISVCESEIVDHIILMKHREKYLEKIQYPELETLRNCQMSDLALSSVIAEMCERVEHELGRGEPEVYYAKNSLVKV